MVAHVPGRTCPYVHGDDLAAQMRRCDVLEPNQGGTDMVRAHVRAGLTVRSRVGLCGRSFLAALLTTASVGALVVAGEAPAAADPVTTVKGEACAYSVKVGLFGGPQGVTGCNEGINANNTGTPRAPQSGTDPFPADTSYSPHVRLPADGSGGSMSASDSNGAKGVFGPAVIHGGLWPCEEPGTDPNEDGYVGNCLTSAPPSGPQNASTEGSPSLGTVTSTAEILLHPTPIPIPCYTGAPGGYGPDCADRGGFGPFPVSGDSMHVECSANGSAVSGSTTFSNAELATATDGEGTPTVTEPVPDNPPPNYTRHGVITNVGDVFTVVYNEQTVNPDGSLTVIGTHMYLFGPVAIGEVRRGEVTCGTDLSVVTADTLAPSCGTPVVKPMGPENPTPESPRSELVGTFDARGLQSVTNIEVTNGTVQVGEPHFLPYRQFVPGQTGPLQITATRTQEAEDARLPMHWSFDVTDAAGNTSHCLGFEGPPAANDDAYTAYKNATLTVPASGVLGNDSDGNDDPMTTGSASDPANGSVTLGSDGSFIYTPDADFVGTDTFTYVADDGRGLTDTGTVTLTVEAITAPTELRITDGLTPVVPWDTAQRMTEGGDGEATPHTFTVTRSGSTAAVSTVQVASSGGTATAGTDYTALPLQTLTFAVGETSKTLTVSTVGDYLSEDDETFKVVLSEPTNAYVTDNVGVGTIVNDDEGLPRFAVDDEWGTPPPSVQEGDSGSTPVTFTIYRNGNTNGSSTVSYRTSGGTATAGTDYTAVPLTSVTFEPGEWSRTVDVDVAGDLTAENNETVKLVLSAPVGATIADAAGSATIIDDEGPVAPGPATFVSITGGFEQPESSGGTNFFILRSGDTSGTTTATYNVVNGTATAGTDFTANEFGQYPALSGTLTFGPGESAVFLDVAIIDDNLLEPNETFDLVLSAPTGGVITVGTSSRTILNDDGSTFLSVDDPYFTEGNSGTTAATFTITRSGNTSSKTTVKYATKTLPSAEANDFTALPLTKVVFAPGETTKTVTVNVTGDTAVEANERFTLALSTPVGATLQDSAGTALIINDD